MSTKGYFCIYIAVFQHRTNNRYTVDIVGGVIKHKKVNILIQSCLPRLHQRMIVLNANLNCNAVVYSVYTLLLVYTNYDWVAIFS